MTTYTQADVQALQSADVEMIFGLVIMFGATAALVINAYPRVEAQYRPIFMVLVIAVMLASFYAGVAYTKWVTWMNRKPHA